MIIKYLLCASLLFTLGSCKGELKKQKVLEESGITILDQNDDNSILLENSYPNTTKAETLEQIKIRDNARTDQEAVSFIKDFYTSYILANIRFPIDDVEELTSKYFSKSLLEKLDTLDYLEISEEPIIGPSDFQSDWIEIMQVSQDMVSDSIFYICFEESIVRKLEIVNNNNRLYINDLYWDEHINGSSIYRGVSDLYNLYRENINFDSILKRDCNSNENYIELISRFSVKIFNNSNYEIVATVKSVRNGEYTLHPISFKYLKEGVENNNQFSYTIPIGKMTIAEDEIKLEWYGLFDEKMDRYVYTENPFSDDQNIVLLMKCE